VRPQTLRRPPGMSKRELQKAEDNGLRSWSTKMITAGLFAAMIERPNAGRKMLKHIVGIGADNDGHRSCREPAHDC
jgi:hypothetical protein